MDGDGATREIPPARHQSHFPTHARAPGDVETVFMLSLFFGPRRAVTSTREDFSPEEEILFSLGRAIKDGNRGRINQLLRLVNVDARLNFIADRMPGLDQPIKELLADGGTVLILAVGLNDHITVEALIKNGANANIATVTQGLTPLMLASHSGQEKCVDALISTHTVDVNIGTSKEGLTPLMLAAEIGHVDICTKIVGEPGCNVNARVDRDGVSLSASDIAERAGHDAVVLLLSTMEDRKGGMAGDIMRAIDGSTGDVVSVSRFQHWLHSVCSTTATMVDLDLLRVGT